MNIISILFALLFSLTASATTLDKIVVFGDSLSDNGNLYEYMDHELPVSPPYYNGRFCNGPVWVELLSQMYYPDTTNEHLLDFAFGSAGVSEDDEDGVLFTLHREVDSYFLSHQDKADAHSLYVVFIGSNNYLGIPDEVDHEVETVISGITHELERLVSKGAKHIMVVNVPDLGKIPTARDVDAVELLSELSLKHNTHLKKTLAELERANPSVQWLQFDVSEIMRGMIDFPSQYGFTNVVDTCYKKLENDPDACAGYMFFDEVHPSALAHVVMAERTKKMLDDAGIMFE